MRHGEYYMLREYHRWPSRHLGRDMEVLTFGHAGTPMVVFPTSMGTFFDYEDRGMVAAVADKINAGLLRLVCVTTLDTETFYSRHVPPRMRVDPSAIVPPIAATRDVPSQSTNLPVRHESHSPHGP